MVCGLGQRKEGFKMLNLSPMGTNVTKENEITANEKGATAMQLFNYDNIKSIVENSISGRKINPDDLNDKGFSRMFADIFSDVLRYNPQNKCWYYYNGKVWQVDARDLAVRKFAKMFSDELTVQSDNFSLCDREVEKLLQLNSSSKRNTIIHDAECELPIDKESFDLPVFLFNCQNGTLDLSTCILKDHNPKDLLTKISNVTYNSDAKCERWERFINEIMDGDKDKVDYLQRILGYCLTGDLREEQFYIFYGATSRNGKSTLLETVSNVLGGDSGYSAHIATSSFSGTKGRSAASPSSDIARLAGARMAITSELPYGMLLDAGLLKKMTGNDKITVRNLYATEFEFTAQFKLFMNTNHLPQITDNSVFESKRVNVIEFNHHFTEQKQDKNLKFLFQKPENMSGILNWLLEGWQKVCSGKDSKGNKVPCGMSPPQSVIDATSRFREDCDKVSCFIEDCLEHSDSNIKFKDLYEAYQRWTLGNGYACEQKSQFKVYLNEKNMLSRTGLIDGKTARNVIKGYAIRNGKPKNDIFETAAV